MHPGRFSARITAQGALAYDATQVFGAIPRGCVSLQLRCLINNVVFAAVLCRVNIHCYLVCLTFTFVRLVLSLCV